MRHLTSKSKMLITTKVFDSSKYLKASMSTTLRKVSSSGPELHYVSDPTNEKREGEAKEKEEEEEEHKPQRNELVALQNSHQDSIEPSGFGGNSFVRSCSGETSKDRQIFSMTPDASSSGKTRPRRLSIASTCASGRCTENPGTARRHSSSSCLSWDSNDDICMESMPAPIRSQSLLIDFPVSIGTLYWDWPLSRAEKKALVVMCDRQDIMLQEGELTAQRKSIASQCNSLFLQISGLSGSHG
jgi:hypothetical protein